MRQAVLLLLFVSGGDAATKPMPDAPFFDNSRVSWPSPETLMRDLRSENERTRMEAFHLYGLADNQLSPFEAGLTTEQIELHYAALGDDAARKAILALTIGQMTYVAVAIPNRGGWQRIGIAACWCKYDRNPLREFLELRPMGDSTAPRFELVLRDSGGGTGIYEQAETHFRVYNGKPRKVISFQSRRQWCRPTAPIIPCEVDRRWFDGQTLVEAHGQFDRNSVPEAAFRFEDLQNRYFTRVTCTPYKWDGVAFRYTKTGPAASCAPIKRRRDP